MSETLSVTEFIALAMRYLRDRESSVPVAVAETWKQHHGQLDAAALAELARNGIEAALHRALSSERFLGPRVIEPSAPATRTAPVRIRLERAPSGVPQIVRLRILDVPYVGRDGQVHPLSKFILTDVEAVIERATRTIDGQTRVRDWFCRVRDAMRAAGTDRLVELPEATLRELNADSPFAND